MKIRSLDNAWTFTLSVTETDSERLPSVNVSIALNGEFSAKNPSVWYKYEAIIDFVTALKRLERSRAGEAALDSMSPGECSLRIKCVGSLGNVILHINIYRNAVLSEAPGYAKNMLAVTFEVNGELIHRIISDFSELATVCSPTPHAH